MKVVINTSVTDIRAGDKIFVVGRKRPVIVKEVQGNAVKFSGGVAIAKVFERVIERSADIIR